MERLLVVLALLPSAEFLEFTLTVSSVLRSQRQQYALGMPTVAESIKLIDTHTQHVVCAI